MENTEKSFDLVAAIVAYESGEMPDEEIPVFFQYLVDTGLAWNLQGHYGRTAMALIEAGFVEEK